MDQVIARPAAWSSVDAPRVPSTLRATGRARSPGTPVLLERDRRDPRRHGTATAPAVGLVGVRAPAAGVRAPHASAEGHAA